MASREILQLRLATNVEMAIVGTPTPFKNPERISGVEEESRWKLI